MRVRVPPKPAWAVPLVVALLMAAVPALSASPALAASPWWHLISGTRPAYLPREGEGEIILTAENMGDADVAGSNTNPVRIVDTLPAGVLVDEALPASSRVAAAIPFEGTRQPLPCTVESPSTISCESTGSLAPYGEIEVRIAVSIQNAAHSGEVEEASVSGGAAPAVSISEPIMLGEPGQPPPFGVQDYELSGEEEGGVLDLQAGSHPFQQTAAIELNQTADTTTVDAIPDAEPAAPAKDLDLRWPPGLIADSATLPQCTSAEFLTSVGGDENECLPSAAVGVATVTANVKVGESHTPETRVYVVPLFNLEPLAGEPARFGFDVVPAHAPVYVETAVRTGEDYGSTLSLASITQTAGLVAADLTFWGVPGAASHDAQRGWGCLLRARELTPGSGELTDAPCNPPEGSHPQPLLALASSCGQSTLSSVEGDSWAQPVPRSLLQLASYAMPALDGCNRLQFDPSIAVTPDVQQASTPSGLAIDAHVSLEVNENPTGLVSSAIRDVAVTLPAGVALNPSFANGLQACSEGEIGFIGERELEPGIETMTFTPRLPEPVEPSVNFCPDASKIATVKITTPLLPAGRPLEGAVYLASPQSFEAFPQENPFETLLAMYILAEEPVSGLLVKLPAKMELGGEPGVEDLVPGQILATIEDAPQLPFEDLEIHFLGGERALLATPAHCGAYPTEASFVPWSAGQSYEEALTVHASSTFNITTGPHGSGCPSSALPFAPSVVSGPTNINAGASGSVTTTVSREDGQQSISSLTLHYPAGLSGMLSGVKLCGETQANAGTCGTESEIGETTISTGLGGDPFTLTGGKVYVTGPYDGSGECTAGAPGCAPFGLSIVIPVDVGPFDLQQGEPVVVRAKVEINPTTAALTIATNSAAEGHEIPAAVEGDGVPLQIKHFNILFTGVGGKSSFTLNPTSCDPTQIKGTIDGHGGASSSVEVPFQVTNCAGLKFEPQLSVSTSGATSSAQGASLIAKVTEPGGPQANIAKIKVELPEQIALRQTTLQRPCTSAQFESNPAGCPPESTVGNAKVITPLLPAPLEGPAIFVSRAGEALPSLTMVLQGDGVTIDLAGATSISPARISSTTFDALPDEPFETFELVLPEGPHSALAASGNLCAPTRVVTVKKRVKVRVHGHVKYVTRTVKQTEPASMVMKTEFAGQNGAVLAQSPKIGVTGCVKAKAATLTRAQKLSAALKACREDRSKAKREKCEGSARKRYGAQAKGSAHTKRVAGP